MTPNTYEPNQDVRLYGAFKDVNGALVDPSAEALKLRLPDASTLSFTLPGDGTVVKDATGQYHADLTPAMVGVWFYRWEGSDGHFGAAEGQFVVRRSGVL